MEGGISSNVWWNRRVYFDHQGPQRSENWTLRWRNLPLTLCARTSQYFQWYLIGAIAHLARGIHDPKTICIFWLYCSIEDTQNSGWLLWNPCHTPILPNAQRGSSLSKGIEPHCQHRLIIGLALQQFNLDYYGALPIKQGNFQGNLFNCTRDYMSYPDHNPKYSNPTARTM